MVTIQRNCLHSLVTMAMLGLQAVVEIAPPSGPLLPSLTDCCHIETSERLESTEILMEVKK